jgi:ribosomal protein S24E|tara:strand:+ start:39539 stop:39949 length:411 start_codon:yes stop_codon:yes gene_type:complete
MKLQLVTETKQPLLSRKELVYNIDHAKESTPSLTAIKKAVVEQTKAKEPLVVLHGLQASFGSSTSKIVVNIYDTEAAHKQFAIIDKKKNRNKKPEEKKEEAKPTGKPAEEKKEEKPAEVKVEEKKEEVKTEEKKEE